MDQARQQRHKPDVVLDRIEGALAWLLGGRGSTSTPRPEKPTKTRADDEEVTGHGR